MRGVVFLGDRRAEVRDFPTPDPAPDEVRVRMKAASICGSDMHAYRKGREDLIAYRRLSGGSLDRIAGHEASGIADAVGRQVSRVKPGDRVTVFLHWGCGHCGPCRRGDVTFCPERGAYGVIRDGSSADFILAPERDCMPIPDGLDFERASLVACAGGTAYQSIRRLSLSGADTVAVFGLGPVGLCAVIMAAAHGAKVIGVDRVPERVALAREVGASEAIDASRDDPVKTIEDLTGGRGVDAGADYSGNSNAQEAMMAAAAKGARLAIVGIGDAFRVDTMQIISKQLTLLGSWIYNRAQHDEIVDLVLERDLPLASLITHRFSIVQAPEAYACFDAGKTGKVLFTWEEEGR